MSFSFGESFVLEVIFYVLYILAFLFVGFFVEGLGGTRLLASCLAICLVTLIAYPIQFRFSFYRCKSCDKVYDSAELA